MGSLVPGYEYDIFISYRQKDNKYDGWVTEFVDNLKKELEATFKEDISVYFDINPHDGLLETHDVEASLKEKLKCLVFIPIISRTYCDPKSFAWEHEFKAFIEQASRDQNGLKVKLPNGNIASRVLPVRIHDLEQDDIRLCESVLGGVLRGIEFIYKEAGVNKPLTTDDDNKKNLNNTKYRIQINKVANAIKEIISGLKSNSVKPVNDKIQQKNPQPEKGKEIRIIYKTALEKLADRKLLLGSIFLVVILISAIIIAYPEIFKRNPPEKQYSSGGKISVAVLPFQNNTNDSLLDVWQEGIQEILITSLSSSEDLKVQQNKLISSYLQSKGLTSHSSITPAIASTISKKLDASVLIFGGIKQGGTTLRLNTQIIDAGTEEVIKSFQIEGTSDNLMQTIDSLSVMIRNYLIISKLGKGEHPAVLPSWTPHTNSSEAYRYQTYGSKAYAFGDYVTAKKWFLKSIEIDSTFFLSGYMLSATYWPLGQYDSSKYWCQKLYNKRDHLNFVDQIRIDFMYSKCYGTDFEAIKYLTQLTEMDKNDVIDLHLLGLNYSFVFQFNKAIPVLERALEIYDEWDSKPYWPSSYVLLGKAYHETGQYKKEKRLYKKAEHDFPYFTSIIWRQVILSLTEGDTTSANEYIKRFISILKDRSVSDADITLNLARMYSEAGILDKAEEYFRHGLDSEADNTYRLNALSWFLIDKDRDINEGLKLIEKVLKISPDHYEYLDTKGWGLYKLGKFKESLEILQKSWDLRRQKAVYSHGPYLHLEEAKKAVALQE